VIEPASILLRSARVLNVPGPNQEFVHPRSLITGAG
jgi:hypothetical protein